MDIIESWTDVPNVVSKRNAKYDWDTILDGKIRKMSKGKDFTCKPNGLAMQVYKESRNRKLKTRVAVRKNDVYVQALYTLIAQT